jgi:hypothetical protein
MVRTAEPPSLLDEAVARIQELSAALWAVRVQHEPVRVRRWHGHGYLCPTCRVPHPCATWRALHRHRVAGC